MAGRSKYFWQTKSLTEMSDDEWESLCDGCGRCCLVKFEDEETGRLLYTDIACRLLNLESCRCRDYPNRTSLVSDCMNIRQMDTSEYDQLPLTCAYRRLNEGQPLFDWHPLISGTSESVVRAGISVKGGVISEEYVHPDEILDRAMD